MKKTKLSSRFLTGVEDVLVGGIGGAVIGGIVGGVEGAQQGAMWGTVLNTARGQIMFNGRKREAVQQAIQEMGNALRLPARKLKSYAELGRDCLAKLKNTDSKLLQAYDAGAALALVADEMHTEEPDAFKELDDYCTYQTEKN